MRLGVMFCVAFVLIGFTNPLGRVFAEETNWFTLTSKEGNFSINFPSKPKELSFDRQTIKGVIPYQMWTVERPDRAFNLTYIDIPDITPDDGEKLVDSTFASMAAERIGGKLLDEKDVKIGGHPGKEFTVEATNLVAHCRIRAYMVGVRQFTVQVVGGRERDQKEDLIFLDSFRLLTNRPASRVDAPIRKSPETPALERR